jgi:hypothetical protein
MPLGVSEHILEEISLAVRRDTHLAAVIARFKVFIESSTTSR